MVVKQFWRFDLEIEVAEDMGAQGYDDTGGKGDDQEQPVD